MKNNPIKKSLDNVKLSDEAKERIDESKDAEKMVTMLCRNVRNLAIVERY